MFGLICAGASIAAVYFLYEAHANDAPWSHVFWSIGAGVIAMKIAAVANYSWRRVDYVGELIERGFSKGDAVEAWRTADSGGWNLLLKLQQAELSEQIDRLETTINTPNGEGDSK